MYYNNIQIGQSTIIHIRIITSLSCEVIRLLIQVDEKICNSVYVEILF